MKKKSSYFDMCYETFGYFISNMQLELEKYNKEYKILIDNNNKMRSEYLNVNKIFENSNPKKLNEEECSILIKILENELRIKYIEFEEIFFKGQKEMLYTLLRTDLLNNKDTDCN